MSALQAGVVWDLAMLPARASSVQAGHSPRSAWKRGSPAVQGCHVLVCLKLEQIWSLITSNIRDVPGGGCISLTLCISVLSGLLAAPLWMFSASMVPFWYLYLHWNIHPFISPFTPLLRSLITTQASKRNIWSQYFSILQIKLVFFK